MVPGRHGIFEAGGPKVKSHASPRKVCTAYAGIPRLRRSQPRGSPGQHPVRIPLYVIVIGIDRYAQTIIRVPVSKPSNDRRRVTFSRATMGVSTKISGIRMNVGAECAGRRLFGKPGIIDIGGRRVGKANVVQSLV